MAKLRIALAILCGFVFVILGFVLKHATDLIVSLVAPASFVLIAGVWASWLLISGRRDQAGLGERLVDSYIEIVPWLFMLGCALPFAGIFNNLDSPERLGPQVMWLFMNLLVTLIAYALIALPLKFRFDLNRKPVLEPIRPHHTPVISSSLPVRYVVGLFLLITGLIFALVLKHATDLILSFIVSPPTQVLFIGTIFASLLVGTEPGTSRLVIRVLLGRATPAQLDRRRILNFGKALRIGTLLAGFIGVLIGIMKVFSMLDKPEYIGPGLMVSLVAPLYAALVFIVFVLPVELRLAAALANAEESR